jgi:hypothetical protein
MAADVRTSQARAPPTNQELVNLLCKLSAHANAGVPAGRTVDIYVSMFEVSGTDETNREFHSLGAKRLHLRHGGSFFDLLASEVPSSTWVLVSSKTGIVLPNSVLDKYEDFGLCWHVHDTENARDALDRWGHQLCEGRARGRVLVQLCRKRA